MQIVRHVTGNVDVNNQVQASVWFELNLIGHVIFPTDLSCTTQYKLKSSQIFDVVAQST